MISDDHIPQIPLDHHDSIFKLPCGGKESPKGIQKIVATQVSPQSEMVSMSDVGAWHFNGATNSFTLPWSSWSNFSHGEPWPLDASSLHWGTWHLQIAQQNQQNLRIRRSMDDQLMISWWSMDDQLMISWWSVDDQWMINGWSVDDQLMISWWSMDDQLMISWWSVDDELMTWEDLLSYLRLQRKESPKGSGPIREP